MEATRRSPYGRWGALASSLLCGLLIGCHSPAPDAGDEAADLSVMADGSELDADPHIALGEDGPTLAPGDGGLALPDLSGVDALHVDGGAANVTVTSGTTYQTWIAWEANTASAPTTFANPAMWDQAMKSAVDELGLTALRMDIPAQLVETTAGGATWVNDDADPNNLVAAGFQFPAANFDKVVTDWVLPFRAHVLANGDDFQLRLSFIGYDSSTLTLQNTAPEYGEFILAVVQHLQSAYGLIPDRWDVRNEPDLKTIINGTQEGKDAVAAAARLAAAGLGAVHFNLPSVEHVGAAATYFNQAMAVPGASAVVDELSYHRYDGNPLTAGNVQALKNLAAAAKAAGVPTGVSEWCFGDHRSLWQDLVYAEVSRWSKYVLIGGYGGPADPPAGTYTGPCMGNQLYYADFANNTYTPRAETWYLRQYMRYIRPGAVRVDATTTLANVEPVAFRSPAGKIVVVANTPAPADLSIAGLPAGDYLITYSTASAHGVTSGVYAIAAGENLLASIPAAGVVTAAGL